MTVTLNISVNLPRNSWGEEGKKRNTSSAMAKTEPRCKSHGVAVD